MPISDGSNPEWGTTGHSIEGISDPFKCGQRNGYGDLQYGHMRPWLLVFEVRAERDNACCMC